MDEHEPNSPIGHDTSGPHVAVEVEVFLDLDASPDRVWRALTTDGGLAPWMGEGATVDPRPGGLVALPDPAGGATRRGRVERVDEGKRLDFDWWPALRPAEQTSVSITVSPTGSGCRVRVNERPRVAKASTGHRAIGLWSWRLALLSFASCMSRI